MKTKLTFLLALTFLFLFSGSSVVFGNDFFQYLKDTYTGSSLGSHFSESDKQKLLSTKKCRRCDLSGANLTGTKLNGADLWKADLTKANLSGADLTKANLSGADLSGADLSGTNLTGTNLTDANLTDAKLDGANLEGVMSPPIEVKIKLEVRRIMELKKEGLCSKKFPKAKNMITVKGLYIGMNFCDVLKMYETSKYKSVLQRMNVIPTSSDSYFKINNEGRVTKIHFENDLLHELFKSKDMSLQIFAENFGNHYIGGTWEMEGYGDVKNNIYGYKYYNGEVGYKIFIKQNKSGTGVESLTIEEVAKVSEGFGD